MGREIRMVPANWQHPMVPCRHSPWANGCDQSKRNGGMCYQPVFDRPFSESVKEWKEGLAKWERREDEYADAEDYAKYEYWEYSGAPPDRAYYMPDSDEPKTWFQVYETVSEGTPISPPFATKEELIDWLCNNKDFWNQCRAHAKLQKRSSIQDGCLP